MIVVADKNGFPTNNVVGKLEAHLEGIPHINTHVYVYRINNGEIEILLQKRAQSKKYVQAYNGLWDISASGHMNKEDKNIVDCALRELEDETGIIAKPEELVFFKKFKTNRLKNKGKRIHNIEANPVFFYEFKGDENFLHNYLINKKDNEVDELNFVSIKQFKNEIKDNKNFIKKYVRRKGEYLSIISTLEKQAA
ncbi:NUDIX domain-containing protein [Candidatus Gracilibacteria bacterium]|nr:NUDIX domain-containing protein [Candidatus Gracilibacteria bacterium]